MRKMPMQTTWKQRETSFNSLRILDCSIFFTYEIKVPCNITKWKKKRYMKTIRAMLQFETKNQVGILAFLPTQNYSSFLNSSLHSVERHLMEKNNWHLHNVLRILYYFKEVVTMGLFPNLTCWRPSVIEVTGDIPLVSIDSM